MIPICFFINENFNYQLSVCLTSLFENNDANNLDVYVITNKLGYAKKDEVLNYVKKYNPTINYIEIEDIYKKLPSICTTATYYRLNIPRILLNKYEKVICIDADTAIECDLHKLHNIDLDGNIIAAVRDESPASIEYARNILSIMDSEYINAGVLVIDINKWEENNTTQKILEYVTKNKYILRFSEQDGISKILEDKIKWLDGKYNIINNLKARELLDKNPDDRIIHYTVLKPWNNDAPKTFQMIYNKYEEIML